MSEYSPQLSMAPMMALRGASDDEVNGLLTRWEHPLGPCCRPFGQQGWVLDVEGEPIATAMSASTVSGTIRMDDGRVFERCELVELARIGRAPDHTHILRVMLRIWRLYLAPLWSEYWHPVAAASYAMPGTDGEMYRFDGWQYGGIRKPSGNSGASRDRVPVTPKVNGIADGRKRLYLWPYPSAGERAKPNPPSAREAA